MKKNVMKTMVAAICVVAAGMGGFKAYSFANQAQADMLLAENVDALSQSGGRSIFENLQQSFNDLFDPCIVKGMMVTSNCVSKESKQSESSKTSTNVGVSVKKITIGGSCDTEKTSSSQQTTFTGKQEHKCDTQQSGRCDLGEAKDCDGELLNPGCANKK